MPRSTGEKLVESGSISRARIWLRFEASAPGGPLLRHGAGRQITDSPTKSPLENGFTVRDVIRLVHFFGASFTVRAGPSMPKQGARFKWNDAEKLHRTCETMRDAKSQQRCKTMRILVEEIFNCSEATGGLNWTQVHERIEKLESLKRSGARRRFDELIAARVMEKNSPGFYMPTR